ncbi:MAG: ammonia-forming cytochrome c nitrite reductase subunit c552 [Bryobacteraceae bacterium]
MHLGEYSRRGIAAPLMLAVIAGVPAGVGFYTFGYARGASYMTDDPKACANCHVMREQFEGEERGHAYMLVDQRFTRRVLEFKQSNAAIAIVTSAAIAIMTASVPAVQRGRLPASCSAIRLLRNLLYVSDCSMTTDTGDLQPPAASASDFLDYEDYDVNRDASAQEMRSYVCGQCHVEYYFKGPEKRLTFPWSKGLQVGDALAYYDEVKHNDWIHAHTGTPALKAQHPEFEMWNQGVHARSGVACADCHMPYMREGGLKVSDHHVRSPMLNINRACEGCHHFPEDEMKARVEAIQSRFAHSRDVAMNAVVDLIGDIRNVKAAGKTDAELTVARDLHRKAQFYVDYAEAENSMGFHAPGETLRVLADAVDAARRGQLALRGFIAKGAKEPAPVGPRRKPAEAGK